MPDDERRTTISLTRTTRDRLKGHGRKGETYDALINRLLDELDQAHRAMARAEVEFEPVGREG